ncbi:MAG: 50S ribosomal protein L15 [Magnetovibrionaceae bacterium]
MKLNEIKDNSGATKNRKRVGRGIGSGLGKTAGRGVKGQKSRSGVSLLGFEGGQMPLYRRLPKRGFKAPFAKVYDEINVGLVQKFVDAGKIDAGQPITQDVLIASGVARKKPDGIKLLGKGEVTAKLTLEVSGATKGAIAAVEKAGGSVTISSTSPATGKADEAAKAE